MREARPDNRTEDESNTDPFKTGQLSEIKREKLERKKRRSCLSNVCMTSLLTEGI